MCAATGESMPPESKVTTIMGHLRRLDG